MDFIATPIKDLYEVSVRVFSDERGWFARTYCKREFAAIGHNTEWTQLNHSCTRYKGSIRGLHYQVPPFMEAKMVKCIAGRVFDVAVDLRKDSPTLLQWYGVELSAHNRKMLYIPAGFAHGFQTLEDNCELLYHHTSYYEPGYEHGIRHDDPLLNVRWPLPLSVLSERDALLSYLGASFPGI